MSGVVLLTGATGFVGRQVLRILSELGVRVCVVVRDGKENQLATSKGVERVITTSDLFSETCSWWAGVCEGVDTVIHSAWYVEPAKYLESEKNLDCLIGTLQMARGLEQAGVRRFVGVGTCLEYEPSAAPLSVDAPLRPLTSYGAAKAAAFMSLSQYFAQCTIEFAWCRLFYLYGEGEREQRLVPYVRAKLSAGEPVELTHGSQIRDFLDVQEAGRMIAEVALGGQQGGVNICSGVPVTVRQLVERVADEYGRRDLLQFGVRSESPSEPPCVVGLRNVNPGSRISAILKDAS